MATVRGIPNTPAEPQYAEEPSGFRNRGTRHEVRAANASLKADYDDAVEHESSAQRNFDEATSNQYLKTKKGYVTELVAANRVRDGMKYNRAKEHKHKPYENPTEYIADLWADGFIDDKKAQLLLGKLQEEGGVTASPNETRVLEDLKAREHLGNLMYLETPRHDFFSGHTTPASYPAGSSDKKRREYEKDGVLIGKKEKVELSDESPAGFLLNERERGHISSDELKTMLAWQRGPEKTQSAEELAELRQSIIRHILDARPDMEKGEATLQAMAVVTEIRDPFAYEMEKLAKDTTQAQAASVDIGKLTAVKTGGFADRESARAAARVEDKSPQR